MPVVHELESSVKVKDPMSFVLIENGAVSSIKYKRKYYYEYKPMDKSDLKRKGKEKKRSRARVAIAIMSVDL